MYTLGLLLDLLDPSLLPDDNMRTGRRQLPQGSAENPFGFPTVSFRDRTVGGK